MGRALAERLLERGFSVRGYDIDAARMTGFASAGFMPAPSIGALARPRSAILLAVFDANQAEQVLDQLPARDTPILCVTTCDPQRAEALARERPGFVEVPLSGTSAEVRAGA